MNRRPNHSLLAFALTVVLMVLAAMTTVAFDSETRAKDIGLNFEIQTLFPDGTFAM